MNPFRHVVVATDLSPASDLAVKEADAVARAHGARLTALHVVHVRPPMAVLFPQDRPQDPTATADIEQRAAEAVRAQITAATGRADDDFVVKIEVGEPAPETLRFAEAAAADLVVVASHGRGGFARVLLGSVSDRVVRYAHAPVLVARPSPAAAGPVLATTDLSDPSLPAIDAGVAEARRRGARLVVMSVVAEPDAILPPPGTPPSVSAVPTSTSHAETKEAIALVEARIQEALAARGAVADVVVRAGTARAAIVDEADRRSASLVVVGTRGRTGIKRLALGSVAEGVVHAAPCSVLVVRLTGDVR